MCKKIKETNMFAFVFDSGRLGSSLYGDVVFNAMLCGKEITKNKTKVMIYLGDILMQRNYIDIEPYIINDDYCTIDFNELCAKKAFKDYPFCWVIENIEKQVAYSIDARLKKELIGYVGLSKIDPANTDKRKQFWRELIKEFSIYKNVIECFQDPDTTDVFRYWESANELGFKVKYDKYAEYDESFYNYTQYVRGDGSERKIEKVDRDLMDLNFSLCRELQIAGSLIWKSINDIDKVSFNLLDLISNNKDDKKKQDNPYLPEYSFFTLYHASQGIERLQKIIVELIYKKHHLKAREKTKVSEVLYSHNHHSLNDWIKSKENISLSSNCEDLFTLLQKFYNKLRYARFSDDKDMDYICPEFVLLQDLGNHDNENYDYSIKRKFGELMGKISHAYYELVRKLSHELNINVYELATSSSATIVFYQDNKNLYDELEKRKQAKKELLYWLMIKAKNNKRYKLLKYKPLKFDEALIEDYLFELITNSEDGSELFDDFNSLYDELCAENKKEWKERVEAIKMLIANPHCWFLDDDD